MGREKLTQAILDCTIGDLSVIYTVYIPPFLTLSLTDKLTKMSEGCHCLPWVLSDLIQRPLTLDRTQIPALLPLSLPPSLLAYISYLIWSKRKDFLSHSPSNSVKTDGACVTQIGSADSRQATAVKGENPAQVRVPLGRFHQAKASIRQITHTHCCARGTKLNKQ